MYSCLWALGVNEFTARAPNLRDLAKNAGMSTLDALHLCVDGLDYSFSSDMMDRMLSETLYLKLCKHYFDYPVEPTVPSEDREEFLRACDVTVRHLQRLMPYQGRPTEVTLDRTMQGRVVYMLVHYDNR